MLKALEIYLPEKIIVEILIRLPVQSLLRFKCISKSCNTLISHPKFKEKHYHHAKNNKKILIAQMHPGTRTTSYYSSSFSSSLQKLAKQPTDYTVLCCYDGLVLLWHYNDHLLWNPSTNELVQLPNHEFPDASSTTYGLRYDSTSDDYKILMLHNRSFSCRPLNKILALKCGSSRIIYNHPHGFRHRMGPEDGEFHWLCVNDLSKYFMISFNISNEVYGEISLPEGICSISYRVEVTCGVSVLEGMLCAYCTCPGDTEEGTFKLWVMKEYGVKESWTKLFTIRDTHLVFTIPKYMFADGEVLLFYRKGLYNNG
ncbi:F-box protein CPR1 [Capsicum chacoense]|uniref:F-box domain-containing protein n=1 Tax=Capsicum annuum TaxID=4072 RepID=A0A1U8H7U1_CAPAN|nr:F-box protein CPR1 [Capsicum annuum]KAF3618566.1 putative beta-glucosidase 18-like [Capsicum annuum]KAF3676917.1 putative beta-glucosidase 18-like [Capsicum annuum]PHT77007.1 hypothetical protein T459_20529 [Capsicum annuum]